MCVTMYVFVLFVCVGSVCVRVCAGICACPCVLLCVGRHVSVCVCVCVWCVCVCMCVCIRLCATIKDLIKRRREIVTSFVLRDKIAIKSVFLLGYSVTLFPGFVCRRFHCLKSKLYLSQTVKYTFFILVKRNQSAVGGLANFELVVACFVSSDTVSGFIC